MKKKLDRINNYETALIKIENTNGFEALYKGFFPEVLDDNEMEIVRKHIFSAYIRLAVILDTICNKDKEELLIHIEDENKRVFILNFIKELIK